MKKNRNVYHTNGLTDLDKFYEDAHKRAKGDSRDKPVATTIHFHKVLEPCNQLCETIPAEVE